MLYIRHLTKYYTRSKPIISDMNLTFPSTGLNIIVGKSGCGKTTLLNMIGTMDQDYIGSIELDGVELSRLTPNQISDYRNYDSSYIFQLNSLFENMTVRQNMELILNLQSKETDISAILEKVGLVGFEDKKVKFLSGGERQRVGIARAIAKDAKIVLADEPTSALDSKNAHKILALLKEISKDRLVIVVTHDTKKAFVYADRIVKLVDGRVVEDELINEIDKEATKTVRKPPKTKLLRPVFWDQLKKSIIINLFIILLVSIGIVAFNIEKEQKKIMNEYTQFMETGKYEFNELRALSIHESNDINFYNVIKATELDSKYRYFQEVSTKNGGLENSDINKISNIFKNANIHLGDSDYGNLVVQDLSKSYLLSESINGMMYYWDEDQRTDYGYYIYNENNKYNIIHGTRPVNDNEILITDAIADHYLLRNGLDNTDLGAMIGTELTIGDIYHIGPNANPDESYLHYYTIDKEYIVKGIIGTNQLDYFNYESSSDNYNLLDDIMKQSRQDPYMNSGIANPYGYFVLMDHLDARKTYDFYHVDLEFTNIINGPKRLSSKTIGTFHGFYDYRGITSYDDNLALDRNSRILVKDSGITNLQENEVIISRNLAAELFNISSTWQLYGRYQDEISGETFTLSFETSNGLVDYTFKIAGISHYTTNSEPLMYISEDMYDTIKSETVSYQAPSLTVELAGMSPKDRMKLIDEAYANGYVLVPVYSMPGPYIEFVPTQGEVTLVDDEGYSEDKNISVYYLFSEYYNTEAMNGLNYALEIVSSVYTFVLFMGISLTLGLVYLKEKRQKMTIMKLSQIGVYSKVMISMNFITYLFVALAIGATSYFTTSLLVDMVNSQFTVVLSDVALIHRFRIIMTQTTVVSAIIGVVITLIVGIISSFILVKKSRR